MGSKISFFLLLFLVITFNQLPAQNPVYMLTLTPTAGGREYQLYRNNKLKVKLKNEIIIKGKLREVRKDSLLIDYRFYPLNEVKEIIFNPGTVTGSAAGLASAAGLTMMLLTAGGGKDKEMSDDENILFWSGAGLAATGIGLMIPNYFILKKFSQEEYAFQTVRMNY